MGLTADCIYKRGQKQITHKGQQKIAKLNHREKRIERIKCEKVLCSN